VPVDGTVRHADRIQCAISANGAAKSALIASWQRSACFHRLDPAQRDPPERLTDSEFRKAREEIEPLIQVAQSSLDRLHAAVGSVGCCVLLADRNGVPVERRGAPGDDATFLAWGLWPGAVWSEDSEGTNGIGYLSCRATRADDPPRSALLCAKCAPQLHNCSTLRP
jgi:transcriptional regulator of acetoin/glycerol metabolism